MGPKGRPKTPKGKKPPPSKPDVDPAEVVTELEKEFFQFQLGDIEKKLLRLGAREEELAAETTEIERKTDEFRREKGAVVAEYEQLLAAKEELKTTKRDEMIFLASEIKNRVDKHKQHIQDLQEKYDEMVQRLKAQIEQLEEEIRIMEDFKQNRDEYTGELEKLERQMGEAEMQHQRNLFEIQSKWEKAKGKVQKELQARLLQLSIEFRQKNQNKIGNPCHRITIENKAIQSVLVQMKDEILEYQQGQAESEANVRLLKDRKVRKQVENDKMIARTIVQVNIIKTLMKNADELVDRLQGFASVDATNKALLRKLGMVSMDVEQQAAAIEDARDDIEEKLEETTVIKEAARHLQKSSRRLTLFIRNSLKVAEEASAIRLIPLGGMEEERSLTTEAKLNLFRKRRDAVFAKKGRLLQYLFEFLSRAQLSEEDRRLLARPSSESVDLALISFSQIYGKPTDQGESGMNLLKEAVEEKHGPVYYTSGTSLPRSDSAESAKRRPARPEEEFGECGEALEGEADEGGEGGRQRRSAAPTEDGEEDEGEEQEGEDASSEELD